MSKKRKKSKSSTPRRLRPVKPKKRPGAATRRLIYSDEVDNIMDERILKYHNEKTVRMAKLIRDLGDHVIKQEVKLEIMQSVVDNHVQNTRRDRRITRMMLQWQHRRLYELERTWMSRFTRWVMSLFPSRVHERDSESDDRFLHYFNWVKQANQLQPGQPLETVAEVEMRLKAKEAFANEEEMAERAVDELEREPEPLAAEKA